MMLRIKLTRLVRFPQVWHVYIPLHLMCISYAMTLRVQQQYRAFFDMDIYFFDLFHGCNYLNVIFLKEAYE